LQGFQSLLAPSLAAQEALTFPLFRREYVARLFYPGFRIFLLQDHFRSQTVKRMLDLPALLEMFSLVESIGAACFEVPDPVHSFGGYAINTVYSAPKANNPSVRELHLQRSLQALPGLLYILGAQAEGHFQVDRNTPLLPEFLFRPQKHFQSL